MDLPCSPDLQSAAVGSPRLIRRILTAYLITFVLARSLVFLIMARRIPDIYVYFGETHVHHLNFGIFLLVGVGGYLLLAEPQGRSRAYAAAAYGIGLALTFDEFGMWLHLNTIYWQRASFDAVAVVGGVLGLIAVAPHWRNLRARHWTTMVLLAIVLGVFATLMVDSFKYLHRSLPKLQQMEQRAPH